MILINNNIIKFSPMKKILFMISLLFATVCYAAPPPDPVPIVADDIGFVVDQLQEVDVTVYTFEALEVAEVDIGNAVAVSAGYDVFIEFESILALSERSITFIHVNLSELWKPPLLCINEAGNNNQTFQDRQHSNYGYPFTAN